MFSDSDHGCVVVVVGYMAGSERGGVTGCDWQHPFDGHTTTPGCHWLRTDRGGVSVVPDWLLWLLWINQREWYNVGRGEYWIESWLYTCLHLFYKISSII